MALSFPRLLQSSRRILPTARRGLASSTIERLGTDGPLMSKAVIHNDIVYLSGLIDLSGTSDTVTGQTQTVLNEVDDLLAKAGTHKSNVLSASIWLKDIERDFKDMNAVWVDWMDPDNKPVRATVQSPMAFPHLLVEIQVTAAK
ncbi:RutC family protein [Seminavis robusta]|uniref:RutC family protein n=1 Tax=Seminavis robusta TaxID=568900 RepID=A0A9N8DN62_9STRA|nr:RutC family protein [Seminavis robusta]|eukprot:Sro238_g095450.1 RutC family protein (144) ;mRNA; r:15935-16366